MADAPEPAKNYKDPRFKNELPRAGTISEYLDAYSKQLSAALGTVSTKALADAHQTLERAIAKGRHVYVGGNGGSAAIADHLCCDWLKGTHVAGLPSLKAHSLTANTALLTAIANDFGYEHTLDRQLEMLADKDDVVVLISSSGNSENVVRAATAAKARGATVIGLTGFSGGKLREASDISLHVSVNNYGLAEDAHQALMHVLAQFIARGRDTRTK